MDRINAFSRERTPFYMTNVEVKKQHQSSHLLIAILNQSTGGKLQRF